MPTNNVTRFLDSRKIPYKAFALPTEKQSAEETAAFLDVPLPLIYKSIVVTRKKGGKDILAVVPGDKEVDTSALAKAVGEKKVKVSSQKEAERTTGLQVGGISPLALIQKGFDIILDSSAEEHETIHVSGGELGVNIRLPVDALIECTHALVAPISRIPPPGSH
jgi:Cys-tRNA(Pro)/Cys-tRNA(Cys) deacylase